MYAGLSCHSDTQFLKLTFLLFWFQNGLKDRTALYLWLSWNSLQRSQDDLESYHSLTLASQVLGLKAYVTMPCSLGILSFPFNLGPFITHLWHFHMQLVNCELMVQGKDLIVIQRWLNKALENTSLTIDFFSLRI